MPKRSELKAGAGGKPAYSENGGGGGGVIINGRVPPQHRQPYSSYKKGMAEGYGAGGGDKIRLGFPGAVFIKIDESWDIEVNKKK